MLPSSLLRGGEHLPRRSRATTTVVISETTTQVSETWSSVRTCHCLAVLRRLGDSNRNTQPIAPEKARTSTMCCLKIDLRTPQHRAIRRTRPRLRLTRRFKFEEPNVLRLFPRTERRLHACAPNCHVTAYLGICTATSALETHETVQLILLPLRHSCGEGDVGLVPDGKAA
jgi:hypothetical protein